MSTENPLVNKYSLVKGAARRARQLQSGAEPLLPTKSMKACRVAQDEILQGHVSYTVSPGEQNKEEAPAEPEVYAGVQADAAGQLRAWIEYYRDLGVYDFYRRAEGSGTAEADLTAEAAPESEVQNSVVLTSKEAAAPAVIEVPPTVRAAEPTH